MLPDVVRIKKKKNKGKAKGKGKSSRPPPVAETDRASSAPVRGKRTKTERADSTDRFAAVRDEAGPKRMWVSIAVVVAVVLALALALSAR